MDSLSQEIEIEKIEMGKIEGKRREEKSQQVFKFGEGFVDDDLQLKTTLNFLMT